MNIYNFKNMRIANYDKYPTTAIDGTILKGWEEINKTFQKALESNPVLGLDMYVGVHEDEVLEALKSLSPDLFIYTRDLYKSEVEVKKMTQRFMTDDALFGFETNLNMSDYFDNEKLTEAKEKISACKGKVIVVGSGAALVVPQDSTLVYADMARWELQERYRSSSVKALGIDDRNEPFSIQHKRGYFNDWLLCDLYKDKLFKRVDYWIDTHIPNEPRLIDKKTFFKGINQTISKPFRVVPFFAPAPWGGQWMKEKFGLDKDKINYGWCFDCVPEENSLYLDINGVRFEMPSINLVLIEPRKLLGAPVESRFGKEFPIRFDLLDTVGGGSLSFQVHPTTQYIRETFGWPYTQDESYYMIDAFEDSTVYLGLKNNIDKDAMINDLQRAERGEIKFDPSLYGNLVKAKKHDHYLIPSGTVHCSGPEGLVLEISSTPNHFTFKLWDWDRLDLEGKPRPINVRHGANVIEWHRDEDYAKEKLINIFVPIASGDGWNEIKTGLHENEFIETRRHTFTKTVKHNTNNSVNVLNLVEGEEVIVESIDGSFEPFIVHYAETFIIPAWLNEYTIRPHGISEGKECMTIKAYVRF